MSNVRLSIDEVASSVRAPKRAVDPLRVVSVGTMEAEVKGFRTLIEAVAFARRKGHDVHLDLVGDGQLRPEFEHLADSLAIGPYVTFHGYLADRKHVRAVYDRSDLFVLASYSEGLPRAMIEAMAFGVPSIGTDVGGIPELVPKEFLVPARDVEALGESICRIAEDRSSAALLAAEQLALARDIIETANSNLLAECLATAE